MDAILQKIIGLSMVIFMVGSLLDVGLRLQISEARVALRNVRFVVTALLLCFVLGPALAVLLTKIMPLTPPYALGLVLLGLVPCTPGLPIMVGKANGSLAYMSAFMIVAFAGTVVLMPFMVPLLAKGFTADPWTIAKPLLFFIAIPLVIGMVIHRATETGAEKAAPIVKMVANLGLLILCADLLWLYRSEIIGAVGAYAIATQVLYYTLLGFAAYYLGFGLSYDQRVPMTLGACTRNVGPAFAVLLGVSGAAQGAITMCILGIFLGSILSGFAAAALLKRYCAPPSQPQSPQPVGGG